MAMQTVCNTYWDAGKGNLTAQNTRKTFGGRGSAPDPPDPAQGAYSAPANHLVGGEGLAVPSPRTPSHRYRPFLPRLSYPHSKISSDAVASYGVWGIAVSSPSGVQGGALTAQRFLLFSALRMAYIMTLLWAIMQPLGAKFPYPLAHGSATQVVAVRCN